MAAYVSLSDEQILIRYDGLDADRHEIEMHALGDALRGLSRVIGVAGNYAATGRFVQHKDALEIRVVARAPEAHCFEIVAFLRWATQDQLISAIVAGLVVGLVQYVFSRAAGKKEEMKHLSAALETAIRELGARDQTTLQSAMATINKMADALLPAARQAVAPLGSSARTLTIGSPSTAAPTIVLDEADKASMTAEAGASQITPEDTHIIHITELDIQTGACKFHFDGDPEVRVSGKITDPVLSIPNNPYALSLAQQAPVTVRAKAQIESGAIMRLFISDTA